MKENISRNQNKSPASPFIGGGAKKVAVNANHESVNKVNRRQAPRESPSQRKLWDKAYRSN